MVSTGTVSTGTVSTGTVSTGTVSTGTGGAGEPGERVSPVSRVSGWLRGTRGGLFTIAVLVGAGAGLGAVVFRYLINAFTWLATGHADFGQQGRVPSLHLPWLGVAFFVVVPVVGGLLYGPLIYRFAREARGHGVPEVMIAVAEQGGRIRPQVAGVKALASALCIGVGGSVGREGPIVQIGSAIASSLGQWVRMPENRLRILVACGAAGGISATFNAPITGVFFGVEIILREFSIEAIFTVMLSAMLADVVGRAFLGGAPFFTQIAPGIGVTDPADYLLVALLAVVAGLLGLAFKSVLYGIEDLCDRAWRNRPEWARPAVGGVLLGVLLLALPQMYGVGYPVMYAAFAGNYALWFLVLLAAAKMVAAGLSIGIGGSGGVFAPSLFVGATAGMAFGGIAAHLLGPAAGQPALYALAGMGAVFASAARAPLTSLASVVEMTGDYSVTLPVMLSVAIATTVSRAVSYGTIYTTKLLRRGTDIDAPNPYNALSELTVADAMRRLPAPLDVSAAARDGRAREAGNARAGAGVAGIGSVTRTRDPQVLFGNEALGDALRQLERYGRDGLPVLSTDGRRVEGWITNHDVIRAVGARLAPDARAAPAQADPPARDDEHALNMGLAGYDIVEVTVDADAPAAGRAVGEVTWPPGYLAVSVLHDHGRNELVDADPGVRLRPGDRVNVLVRVPDGDGGDGEGATDGQGC